MEQRRKLKNDCPKGDTEKKISLLLELLLVFLALIFLSSCGHSLPEPQEMGNMALLRSFAVDKGEDWLVTVSTGKQMKSLSQEPPLILQGEGLTLEGACQQINSYTADYVFYGYVDQLILGEDLAEEGLQDILTYFTTNPQLSLGTGIWLAEGLAQELIYGAKEEGLGEHLQTITQESELGISGITRKAGEVLAEIKGNQSSYLPIINTSEEGVLTEGGYGILEEDRLVALFQGDLAKGFELLACHDQLVEIQRPEGAFAMDLSQMKRKITATWSNDPVKQLLSLDISLEMEGKWQDPRADSQALLALQETLAQQILNSAVALQSLGCDPLSFQGALALRYPQQQEYLKEQWETAFSQAEITVSVAISGEKGL